MSEYMRNAGLRSGRLSMPGAVACMGAMPWVPLKYENAQEVTPEEIFVTA